MQAQPTPPTRRYLIAYFSARSGLEEWAKGAPASTAPTPDARPARQAAHDVALLEPVAIVSLAALYNVLLYKYGLPN